MTWRSFLALGLLVASACVPQTEYRRSALVLSPTGESLTSPVRRQVQLAGTVTHTDTATDLFPVEGDPAMLRAEWMFTGQARFALNENVALGGHGTFSNVELSHPSALGTPPVHRDNVWGIGPNFSGHYRHGEIGFSGSFALTVVSAPWTSWRRIEGPDIIEMAFDESEHQLLDSGRERLWMLRTSFAANFFPHEIVEIFAGLSIQNSPTNIGFDDEPRDGSTLHADDWGVVPYLGAAVHAPQGVFVSFQYHMPLGYTQMATLFDGTYGGFQMTLGIDVGRDLDEEPEPPVVIYAPGPAPPPGHAPPPSPGSTPPQGF